MIPGKIFFFVVIVCYSIYVWQYANWEKTVQQNSFGSFFIRICVIADILAITLSFLDELYFNC